MSKQKRITDSKELEDTIDRLRDLQRRRVELAEKLDAQALAIFKEFGEVRSAISLTLPKTKIKKQKTINNKIWRAMQWRKKADKLRNIKSTEKRLRHFSLKLAELRTGTLPGMLADDSVAV